MSNLRCGLEPASFQHNQQIDLSGHGDNIPTDHVLIIAISATPGGPYTALGPLGGVSGNNTLSQQVQNIFPSLDGVTPLTPGTTYYYRTEERDGLNNIIDTSAECSAATTNSPSDYFDDCFFELGYNSTRNDALFGNNFDDLPLNPNGSPAVVDLRYEFGPTAVGPWTLAPLVDNAGNPSPNPQPAIPGSNSSFTAYPLLANTTYFGKQTLIVNGVDYSSTVCGGEKTFDYPQIVCSDPPNITDANLVKNITQTSADVQFKVVQGQGGGRPFFNDGQFPPTSFDTLIVHYGTTPGGPYPTTLTTPSTFTGGTVSLSGLTPCTQYYFIREASEQFQTAGVFGTSPECTFKTACPTNRAADADLPTNLTNTTADLHGTLHNTQPGDTYEFEVGPSGGPYTTTYCGLTPVSGADPQAVTCPVTGLTPSTTYCYRTIIRNSSGVVVATSPTEQCFMTPPPRAAFGAPPADITPTTGTANGSIENTQVGDTWNFVWGPPGGPYTNVACLHTPVVIGNPQAVSCPLTGLPPNSRVCYKVQIRDAGDVVRAESPTEVCFQTPREPPQVATQPPAAVTNQCATLKGDATDAPAGCQYVIDYGTIPGGPYDHTAVVGTATGASPEAFSANVCGLRPNTTYYTRARIICNGSTAAVGQQVPFSTMAGVYWCGGLHDPSECVFVPGQDPYFNCNGGI